MDRLERTRAVKSQALELGFDKVGIARADHADPRGRLRAWLEAGHDAQMGYLRRTVAEREDPRVLMPEARSVVAVALSYYDPDSEPKRATAEAKISRYAQGTDYHKVLRKKLRALRRFMLTLDPEAKVHPCVDTSAVLERAWAERAGIAWIGKSTMAIAQDLGTYTFLGALVTSMELDVDEPHADRCGSCRACLDACPTSAFVAPRILDANKCITYWTVEHRAAFDESTPDLHGWLAGCDICQEVCPWNKFARPCREPKLKPRPELVTPDLERFAEPDESAWRSEVLASTALQRTGEAALSRNARRILGKPDRAT